MNIEIRLRGSLAEEYWTVRETRGKTEATAFLLTMLSRPAADVVTVIGQDLLVLERQPDPVFAGEFD